MVSKSKSERIKTVNAKNLPKQLYAKKLIDSQDAPWFEASAKMEELAEKGEICYVGEYELVKVHKVSLLLVRQ